MERKFTGERLEPHIYNENTIKHLHRYAAVTDYINNKIILDIASGEGYGSNLMSTSAAYVYGVDIDEETIAYAKRKYRKDNLNFLVGSTSKIPLEGNSVDVVISFETIEHHDEHNEMFEEIKRVLRPNGIIVISTPDKHYYSDLRNYNNPYHVKELYKDDFIDLVRSYFSNYHILSQSYSNGNSLILNSQTRETTTFHNGDFLKLEQVTSLPVFLIAIASDTKFVVPNNSIFDGSGVLKAKVDGSVGQVYNSTTYKVGNLVLFPFKVLKRIINSLKSRK